MNVSNAATGVEFANGRRHEERVAGPRTADPVLRPPELARALAASAPALQQPGVHLADEPQVEWKRLQPFEAVHHRIDGVRDFAEVFDRLPRLRFRLETQEVRQGRLRSLDSICEDRTASLRTYM
jgi:hypothetical protein